MKPYYDEGGIVIYHGDCREILPHLEPVDLVLTDPPYNVGKDYGQHDDEMAPDEYQAWCAEWFGISRSRAQRMIVFPGHGNLGMWYAIRRPSAVGCWYKPGNHASSIIGFEEWEPWLYWCGNNGMMGGSTVIRATVGKQAAASGHPCPKPLSLMKKLLIKSRAETTIDPFMGSGTTLRAAKDLGRKAIGIEIEERYCEIAAKRLAQQVFDFGDQDEAGGR